MIAGGERSATVISGPDLAEVRRASQRAGKLDRFVRIQVAKLLCVRRKGLPTSEGGGALLGARLQPLLQVRCRERHRLGERLPVQGCLVGGVAPVG